MREYFFFGLLLPFALLGSCAMPSGDPGIAASASSAGESSISESAAGYHSVWVAPPVGSLLGGGFVRVPDPAQGSNQAALLGTSSQVLAVSRSPGASARELQFQQDRLQLRFGELCGIKTIARGRNNKVHEIAALKSKDQSSTELATANSVSATPVGEPERNTNQTTANPYSSTADRAKGGQDKMKKFGARPQVLPGN